MCIMKDHPRSNTSPTKIENTDNSAVVSTRRQLSISAVHLVISVVDNQIAPPARPERPIRFPQLVLPILVLRVSPDLGHRCVVTDDGFVVRRTGEALGDGESATRMVDCDLEGNGWESFLPRERAPKGEGAHPPSNVSDIGGSDRTGESEFVVLIHHLVLVRSGWKVYMLFVQILREIPAKLVKRHCCHLLAHQRQLRDVVQAAAPAQYVQCRQNLQ